MGHTDKNGQCALVHAALKGHADIINILLGQDWGTEITGDPQQHPNDQNVTLKTQAVQQALTAAASLGHTQACISPEKNQTLLRPIFGFLLRGAHCVPLLSGRSVRCA